MQLSSCKAKISYKITFYYLIYPNLRKPSGRRRFYSFSMSKVFLDRNLFNDPEVRMIHHDYPDYRAEDVRHSIVRPPLDITDLMFDQISSYVTTTWVTSVQPRSLTCFFLT